MKMFLLQAVYLLAAAVSCFAGNNDWWEKAYVPVDYPIPMKDRKLMQTEDVLIKIPKIGVVPIGKFLEKVSLAGQWKFSGVETSELPFPATCEEKEKQFADTNFDDSKWETMKVTHNWWKDGKYQYDLIFVHCISVREKKSVAPVWSVLGSVILE